MIGGRSEATCKQLWRSIPESYQQGVCYSDFWKAYQAVMPDEQHEAVGKETGLTAHVERFNNTIRQRTGPAGAVMSKTTLSPLCQKNFVLL